MVPSSPRLLSLPYWELAEKRMIADAHMSKTLERCCFGLHDDRTVHVCLIHIVSQTFHGSSSFSTTSLEAVELAARPVEGVSPSLLPATGVGISIKESDKPRSVRISGRKEACFLPIA